jgi:hypothetical protein
MRDKLNESKGAQIGLVVVLALVAAFFLLHKGGGESGETAATAPEETAVTGEALTVAAPAGGMGELPTSVPDAKAPPHAFRAAYQSGSPVALLIVHNGGIDDKYTKEALKEVAQVENVHAFVVPAKKISDYASVTVGLNINQVPALIMLRPQKLSHGTPQGTVLYGYQTPEAILQAVRDAVYVGPEKSIYHPG